ncbi:hypothetical protein [Ornithinimicrobium avium]|uniref:hypothetical protein n=1 Tax=Ornithinimicrobium avium TaxID=2283195 RepID=UPI001D195301|nr:hypothetical protein [Ornithinimicrobium avium]
MSDSPPGKQATVATTSPTTMAQVRERRRRQTSEAAHLKREQERRDRAAAATSELESLIERTAAELHLLQARHTLLFATYTRAYVRAYSRATTVHAPEPAWMLHIARPQAVSLTQSVLSVEGDGHAA